MTNIDRDIAEAILGANGLKTSAQGLRFDRVALRVLAEARAFVEASAPAGAGVLMTLTAPIRLAGRTAAEIKTQLGDRFARTTAAEDMALTVHGNAVRLRVLEDAGEIRFVGFVHNPSSPAERLLDLAEAWMRARAGD